MRPPLCAIAPPYLLLSIVERGNRAARDAAVRALVESAAARARRVVLGYVPHGAARATVPGEHLDVYDVRHGGDGALPGRLVRSNGAPPAGDSAGDSAVDTAVDTAVDEAYDGADRTYAFYRDVLGRDSVDGAGLPLVSSVHYLTDFDNAFWNGSQMVYGDGSGEVFVVGGLTRDIDVIAHELTHGVTQYTAALTYHGQSGALNESMSDVFGSLVKQYTLGQTAAEADWLIGAGVLGSALHGTALRSMAAPGTAYDGDPQPADMGHYVELPDDDDPRHDHGGVHLNSGIPNHAFFLAATAMGGHAWEAAGPIWYDALTTKLSADADFVAAARATIAAAGDRFGAGSPQQQAVQDAWRQVKVG